MDPSPQGVLSRFREAGAAWGRVFGKAMATYFLGLTASQVAEVKQDHRLRREWFGSENRGMLPLKIHAEDAASAHVRAHNEKPSAIISVILSLEYFHELIQNEVLVPCLHIRGYRLYADLHFDGKSVVSADVIEVL